MRRSGWSRDFRISGGPEISGDFVPRFLIEVLRRSLVGSSCEEISNRGLGKTFRVTRRSGDFVEGPLIYKSCQVESSCKEISYGFPTRRSRDIRRFRTEISHRGLAKKSCREFLRRDL